MTAERPPPTPPSLAVTTLEPLVHVADVEASLAFYSLLGFQRRGDLKGPEGRTHWASAASSLAGIMFAQADPDPIPEQQAVLFYMWSDDIAGLRKHLLASGVHDAGAFCGMPGPHHGRRVVFNITHPDYAPGGELRLHDPDGYCILIGQRD